MWFAGTNMFNTVFVFQMNNPLFLPHTEYLDLLNKNIISEIMDSGHVKLNIRRGDNKLIIYAPDFPAAGQKTNTLQGFISDTKENAIKKLNGES